MLDIIDDIKRVKRNLPLTETVLSVAETNEQRKDLVGIINRLNAIRQELDSIKEECKKVNLKWNGEKR